jgi:hypothetical protein
MQEARGSYPTTETGDSGDVFARWGSCHKLRETKTTPDKPLGTLGAAQGEK